MPETGPPVKAHVTGAASVEGVVEPGQPAGIGPGDVPSGWTAIGMPGWEGGGRSRSGSPETRTPAGAVVHRFVAPPEVTIWPTTSHCGAESTPLPLSCRAPGGVEQFESIWTVPSVVTAVPGEPLILFVPQPVGSRASSEYGRAMSLSLVATAIAPVRCWLIPKTPAKNDGRVDPMDTSMCSEKPALVDGAIGGMSTRTVRPPTPST